MSPATLTSAQFQFLKGYSVHGDSPTITIDDAGNATYAPAARRRAPITLDPKGNAIDLAKQHRDTVLQALADAWAANPNYRLGELVGQAVEQATGEANGFYTSDAHVLRGLKELAE